MDFIPQFADCDDSGIKQKSSQETNPNIEGSTEPDHRIELEEYMKNYLEALKNPDLPQSWMIKKKLESLQRTLAVNVVSHATDLGVMTIQKLFMTQ